MNNNKNNSNDVCKQELDDMKKRLKEMEDEAAALREMQAKVEKEMGSVQGLPLSLLLCVWIWFITEILDTYIDYSCVIFLVDNYGPVEWFFNYIYLWKR